MGIREGTESSNLSKNLLVNTINTSNSDSLNNQIQNSKTVTRKIDDYPIKKFIKNKHNNINSIN